ncbi:hypothetical protein ACO1O0_007786 [Amphichorda felina]
MDEPPPLEGDESYDAPAMLTHAMGGGDVVLVLDLPEVFNIGYDCISFTAKHFGGLRDIPPGAHFIWVAHPNAGSTRCGAWIASTTQNQVHVLQWDRFNEVLGEPTRSEARIQADNVSAIHSKLVPYADPTAVNEVPRGHIHGPTAAGNERIWNQLSGCVTAKVLNRITGQHHGDWFTHTGDRVKGTTLMAAEVELDKRITNPFLHGRELDFTFSQLSKTYSTNATGAERTLEATDSTTYILSLLDDLAKGLTEDDLVGEFQLAYLVGTHLGNDACMQQWWYTLLKIILRAYTLPTLRPSLAATLFRTIAAQLSHNLHYLESSVLDYSDAQARDLRLALTVYKRRLDDLPEDPMRVSLAFAHIEAVVAGPPLDWDLHEENYVRRGMVMTEDGEEVEVEMTELAAEDERGEWAPEVVELDDTGKEKGLVSWTD